MSLPLADGPLAGAAAALGVGLLVGLERERRKGEGPDRQAAGIRSFTVVALLGALAQGLSQALAAPGLLLLGGAMVGALAVAAYWRSAARDPGLTTELAMCATYLIGLLCMSAPAWGAGAGALLALLLAARGRLHHFATRVLTEHELHDGLLLAALALVAVPLLPAGPQAWLGGADLRRLAALVLLILLLQAVGHVALRLFGARTGLALSGFLSGFVSSLATIASIGARARHGDVPLRAAQAGALASSAATWIQSMMILGAIAPPLAWLLLPAALAGATVALALVAWLSLGEAPTEARPPADSAMLRVREAAAVALMIVTATLLLGAAGRWLGERGVVAGAALAGVADAHAAMAALGGLSSGGLAPGTAIWGVWAALLSNSAVRAVAALASGGRRFGALVGVGLAAQLAAAALALYLR
ncbi:MgtC/SapB family protein [Ideonella alba]|uniref:MgtC/SapB family protein n=1 Tax=Ideonella alba TaxID=2824118 RepID=A0A940YAJ6_9BURK|nr:MgtC/SapB family protein [Ideonella alba]MBQ0931626.1 MgtC/SapB family protein [Ideonella alba]